MTITNYIFKFPKQSELNQNCSSHLVLFTDPHSYQYLGIKLNRRAKIVVTRQRIEKSEIERKEVLVTKEEIYYKYWIREFLGHSISEDIIIKLII